MSELAKCPFCQKYFDATFTVENCPQCSADLRGVDLKTDNSGKLYGSPEDAAHVQTYIILSCISFLFCGCLGFFAIIFSIQSINAKNRGDAISAESSAKTAFILSIISIIVGILSIIGRLSSR